MASCVAGGGGWVGLHSSSELVFHGVCFGGDPRTSVAGHAVSREGGVDLVRRKVFTIHVHT